MPSSTEINVPLIALSNVRSFKDEPTVKTVDTTSADFETYMRDRFPHSMYAHGTADYTEPSSTTEAWETFMADTMRISRLCNANPVTFDTAAQNNGSWFYCRLYSPHVKTSKNINLIIFPEQQYVVSNESSSPLKVFIRRYDVAGKHYLSMPVTVSPGQTARI